MTCRVDGDRLALTFNEEGSIVVGTPDLLTTKLSVPPARAQLAQAEHFVRTRNFVFRMPDVIAAQVLTLVRQGNLSEAAHLAEIHSVPVSQARVQLAHGDPVTALALLEPLRDEAEAKSWADERLKVTVLQAVALHAHGDKDKAAQMLGEALALAEPGGFTRIFIDEGNSHVPTIVRSCGSRDHADLYR
jgi:tetratricopeptide repeat protein